MTAALMALMKEDAMANGNMAAFRSTFEDLAEESFRPATEPIEDDGVSVFVPGLDPRLRPMGVVGQNRGAK